MKLRQTFAHSSIPSLFSILLAALLVTSCSGIGPSTPTGTAPIGTTPVGTYRN